MKPDVIERLLLDRALGRLDPDVDALLADYLANDASAATQAREFQDVVHLATRGRSSTRARYRAAQSNPSTHLASSRRTGAGPRRLVCDRRGHHRVGASRQPPSRGQLGLARAIGPKRIDTVTSSECPREKQDRVPPILVEPTVILAGLGIHRRRQRKGDGEMNLGKWFSQRFLLVVSVLLVLCAGCDPTDWVCWAPDGEHAFVQGADNNTFLIDRTGKIIGNAPTRAPGFPTRGGWLPFTR